MNQVQQFLTNVKALIDTPEKWAQGHYAGNAAGDWLSIHDKAATCFCITGAMLRVDTDGTFQRAEDALVKSIPKDCVFADGVDACVAYNDDESTTHEDVMTWLDRAIAYAGEHHGVDA